MTDRINKTSFWDKRDNLKNRPSLSYRTIEVIQFLMEKDSVALGIAMERLITEDELYTKTLENLKEKFSDETL